MFVQFETVKGEKIIVGKSKILMIEENKKGATVVLDDGTPLPVSQSFENLAQKLETIKL